MSEQPTIVCFASYFKGAEFLRAAHEQGWRVTLVTKQQSESEDWPRDILADIAVVPDDADADFYSYAAGYLARHHSVQRVVALDEYDVLRAAVTRERLCLPGMSTSTARGFRDKLLMRVRAQQAGLRVPDFVGAFNRQQIADYLERVPPPWILKPRTDAAAIGIQKLDSVGDVWQAVDKLDTSARIKDRATFYLIEKFVAGDIFHVDSLVKDGKVIFAGANRYWRPPLESSRGGIFLSSTLLRGSREEKELLTFNRKLCKALGLQDGAAHAEFIRSAADGKLYFLEIASRVGGAYLAETLEAATGVNLWREWARIETAASYQLPVTRQDYGGIALTLARQEWPETTAYNDPEIFYRVRKRWHVGLVVSSPKLQRVEELVEQYRHRLTDDFAAIAPPLEKPE